jgi:acylphosphatase
MSSDPKKSTCKRVHYWGTVQGVGFRMTTKRVASQFAVTGHVRNLPDGQVEVVVAGDADEVMRFLDALAARMVHYIDGHKIADEPETAFASFEIRI